VAAMSVNDAPTPEQPSGRSYGVHGTHRYGSRDSTSDQQALGGPRTFGIAREESVRAMLTPTPEMHYPAPWEAAEITPDGKIVVVCADGHYTCEAASQEAALIIVTAVNALAEKLKIEER
jgi:hypothetical protein